MSVTDVTARIQQLQSQLASLSAPVTPAAGQVAGRAGGVLGQDGDFAAALSAASDAGGAAPGPGGLSGTTALATAGSRTVGAGTVGAGTVGAGGQAVVDEAKKYLGVPYVWGGTDPATGLDCSGLVQLVYRKLGIDLPRVSYDQVKVGRPVAGLAQAQPGDILGFGSPAHHVGIYIGDHKMIEAPRPGLAVRIGDVYETPSSIRRVLPESSPAGSSVGAAGLSFARVAGAGGGSLPAGTPYAAVFEKAGARYGVSPSLLAAVATQESGFNAAAVSPAGARGLMQLMPATAAGLGVDAMDPTQAVDGAARMLRDLIGQFGRTDLALAAYNAGPGAVHRYGGIPPYPETRSYVPAVLAHQAALERA